MVEFVEFMWIYGVQKYILVGIDTNLCLDFSVLNPTDSLVFLFLICYNSIQFNDKDENYME